jgi:hypothetical protein
MERKTPDIVLTPDAPHPGVLNSPRAGGLEARDADGDEPPALELTDDLLVTSREGLLEEITRSEGIRGGNAAAARARVQVLCGENAISPAEFLFTRDAGEAMIPWSTEVPKSMWGKLTVVRYPRIPCPLGALAFLAQELEKWSLPYSYRIDWQERAEDCRWLEFGGKLTSADFKPFVVAIKHVEQTISLPSKGTKDETAQFHQALSAILLNTYKSSGHVDINFGPLEFKIDSIEWLGNQTPEVWLRKMLGRKGNNLTAELKSFVKNVIDISLLTLRTLVKESRPLRMKLRTYCQSQRVQKFTLRKAINTWKTVKRKRQAPLQVIVPLPNCNNCMWAFGDEQHLYRKLCGTPWTDVDQAAVSYWGDPAKTPARVQHMEQGARVKLLVSIRQAYKDANTSILANLGRRKAPLVSQGLIRMKKGSKDVDPKEVNAKLRGMKTHITDEKHVGKLCLLFFLRRPELVCKWAEDMTADRWKDMEPVPACTGLSETHRFLSKTNKIVFTEEQYNEAVTALNEFEEKWDKLVSGPLQATMLGAGFTNWISLRDKVVPTLQGTTNYFLEKARWFKDYDDLLKELQDAAEPEKL